MTHLYLYKKNARNFGKDKWDKDWKPDKVKQSCTGEWVETTTEYNEPKSHVTVFRGLTCPQCLSIAEVKIIKDLEECRRLIVEYS